jgi:uncharacterized protein YuzE
MKLSWLYGKPNGKGLKRADFNAEKAFSMENNGTERRIIRNRSRSYWKIWKTRLLWIPFTFSIFEEAEMKVTYDKQTDVLYISFQETTVTTKELEDGLAVDYAEDGTVAGIEMLNARDHIGHLDEVLKKVVLENVTVATA